MLEDPDTGTDGDDRGLLCISIQNSCSHEQAAVFHSRSASPPDKEHGYVLKNVRRVAEKYHGSLTVECVNDVFQASSPLPAEWRSVFCCFCSARRYKTVWSVFPACWKYKSLIFYMT
ncbi:MAG: ATP-binding protein [Lachnospiraceae bacterium]|nr:ATP-binding protein [Lachnospiraceae bacterium]